MATPCEALAWKASVGTGQPSSAVQRLSCHGTGPVIVTSKVNWWTPLGCMIKLGTRLAGETLAELRGEELSASGAMGGVNGAMARLCVRVAEEGEHIPLLSKEGETRKGIRACTCYTTLGRRHLDILLSCVPPLSLFPSCRRERGSGGARADAPRAVGRAGRGAKGRYRG